ncbi:hypothetical protein KACC15558_15110 [Brevibacterium ammoniilyticum]|uniref:Secreted protein n=1 Tax=Brevibacterium ammoniilyticum TaxID=1046555 RepID=A0ABP9U4D1_9MICO
MYVRPPWVTGTVSLFVPVSHCGPADAEVSERADVEPSADVSARAEAAVRVERSLEAGESVGSGVACEAASAG